MSQYMNSYVERQEFFPSQNIYDMNPDHVQHYQTHQQIQTNQTQSQQIQVQILPQQDWGDNATAITGDFSDFNDDMTEDGRSSHFNGRQGGLYSKESRNFFFEIGDQHPQEGILKKLINKIHKYFGFICIFCASVCSFVSPILFITFPRLSYHQNWQISECGLECESILIGISFKLFILLFGTWAIFARKPRTSLPRAYELKLVILFLMCIMTFSYWLFYVIRIMDNKVQDYYRILQFTESYVDVLLFIYVISVFVLELRHVKSEFVVKVVRSPDGEQAEYSVGKMSIQKAAIFLLENYYKDFKAYNPWLENAHRRRGPQLSQLEQAMEKKRSRNMSATSKNFTDDFDDNQSVKTETNLMSKKKSASRMNADSKSVVGGNFSANDRFYEEYEYERRLRKRRARLLTSTEEAFAHIRRYQYDNNSSDNSNNLMEPLEAAQAIFTSIARDLRRYLRITRQQPFFSREDILAHLAQCVSYDMSPKSFLQRYLIEEKLIFNERAQINGFFNPQFHRKIDQNWILISDLALYESLEDNLMFVLKQNEVTLMFTCKRLPRFNLIEDILDPKRNKFVLKLNSETTV
ncbi:vang 2 [Brachionus plicatilis]|uniref:Vang 2 n=1 Tax=Brachionus plicatilis TaxID=10195 RepID=A0A3M7R4C5_BRAPC|nr:vang 2 [Brachionus plicatilis]